MFGRIFLGIVAFVSLIWLGYATYDRISYGKQYNPEYIFGDEDEELMMVFNTSQLSNLLQEFNANSSASMNELLRSLNPEMVTTLYISKKRNHLLIKTKESLSKDNINAVFSNDKSLKVDGKNIKYGQLTGSFKNNVIYFSEQNYSSATHVWSTVLFDKNADGSILNLAGKQYAVTDIYIKDGGVIEYKSQAKKTIYASKANDQTVFSNAIPDGVSSYEFYETDYLRHFEPELNNSPLNNWLKYGLVKIKLNGKDALITDYIDGQEPIQVLYDAYKRESKEADNDYFEGTTGLTKLLPTTNFYIYQFDDFVVISASRATCEEIVGSYKLGKSLAQSPSKINEIYSQLPQKVNYRKVDKTTKYALSIYKNTFLTTIVRGKAELSVQNTTSNNNSSSSSFVVGSAASDMQFIDEKSFFVTTKDNKVLFFENDKKKWEQSVDGEIVGNGSIIDIYANQKMQLLVATNKKIYVFDVNGNQPGGFPINLDDQTLIQQPVLYRWKGNGYFIAALTGGKLAQYDNQGRELSIIRTKLNEIVTQPVIWVSANKPFIGISDGLKFEMIQADTRKSYRIFDANKAEMLLQLPNEVKMYGILKNQLIAYDQKGGVSYYEKLNDGKLVSTLHPDKGIVVKDGQLLKLFNSNGLQWGAIKLPFSDVTDVQIFTTVTGATFVATIDALENKVYLWKSNGEKYTEQPVEGSKMVRYYNGYLFTVVDNLIVKYPI
ncbi:MAG: hypothetical protein M9916_09435 [Crocinitomicaceae bacterium]|nr:hypothetical protein [Crocinitomicaceae bacterium]